MFGLFSEPGKENDDDKCVHDADFQIWEHTLNMYNINWLEQNKNKWIIQKGDEICNFIITFLQLV